MNGDNSDEGGASHDIRKGQQVVRLCQGGKVLTPTYIILKRQENELPEKLENEIWKDLMQLKPLQLTDVMHDRIQSK